MDQVENRRVDNSWAWLLAASPLLFLLVEAGLMLSGYVMPGITLFAGTAGVVALLLLDRAALKRSGRSTE